MSDGKKEKALKKIRKLFKLGEDGRGNLTEAETAMRQARALMDEYRISESEVRTAEYTKTYGTATSGSYKYSGVAAIMNHEDLWERILVRSVGMLYGCVEGMSSEYIPETDEIHWTITFYGDEAEVVIAGWTFEYLQKIITDQCDHFFDAVNRYNRSKGDDIRPLQELLGIDPFEIMLLSITLQRKIKEGREWEERKLFKEGMAGAIQMSVRDILQRRQEELSKGTGRELLVVNDSILDSIKKDHPELFDEAKAGKHTMTNDSIAQMIGLHLGDKVDVETKPLQSTPKSKRLGA